MARRFVLLLATIATTGSAPIESVRDVPANTPVNAKVTLPPNVTATNTTLVTWDAQLTVTQEGGQSEAQAPSANFTEQSIGASFGGLFHVNSTQFGVTIFPAAFPSLPPPLSPPAPPPPSPPPPMLPPPSPHQGGKGEGPPGKGKGGKGEGPPGKGKGGKGGKKGGSCGGKGKGKKGESCEPWECIDGKLNGKGEDYDGTVAQTASGKPCKLWSGIEDANGDKYAYRYYGFTSAEKK